MKDNRLMEGIRQTGGQDVPHAADTGTRPISVGWFQISGVHQYLSNAQRLKHKCGKNTAGFSYKPQEPSRGENKLVSSVDTIAMDPSKNPIL